MLIYVSLKGIIGVEPETSAEPQPIKQPMKNVFGFVDDSLNHHSLAVKRNETLSDILESYHLLNTNVPEIANRSKPLFDVRRIKTGKKYHLYTANDSLNTIKYLVYEKDNISFIVYDLCDSINIYSGNKEVKIIRETKSAVITG